MDKKAIKTFALWARERLIRDAVAMAGLLGITETDIKTPLPSSLPGMQLFDIGMGEPHPVTGRDIARREALVRLIGDKAKTLGQAEAFHDVMEEAAYTWFNRLIAIRFMEVNGYLPHDVRLLSSLMKNKTEPDLVTNPEEGHFDLTDDEWNTIYALQDAHKTDDLFRLLFLKECDTLQPLLPGLFKKTDDAMTLLLRLSVTDPDGVVRRLVRDIPEEDFDITQGGQVEIIGWLYQYYNTIPKDTVFKALKKNVKITKENIPAATQLFTPDWIVRYMVENSVGRLWKDGHPETACRNDWTYYVDDAKQEPDVEETMKEIQAKAKTLTPETLTVIDPCMGSGHILVRAFDVLMGIYEEEGWSPRDAARSILENNLYGLDIDRRAGELAYFAVMMKARQYDRRALTRGITPHLYDIPDSADVDRDILDLPGDDLPKDKEKEGKKEIQELLDLFENGKNYGSLLTAPDLDWDLIRAFASDKKEGNLLLTEYRATPSRALLRQMAEVGEMLAKTYDAVVTNPPYMGASGMNASLADFVKKNYPDAKSDLFACFMERCKSLTRKNGYEAMITQHAWMFLSSFEKLRTKLQSVDMVNMAHLGPRAFEEIGGEVVQTTAFVLQNSHTKGRKGVYCRLIEPTSQDEKETMFLRGDNRYEAAQDNFVKIPGSPVAYWASDSMTRVFENPKLSDIAKPRQGLATTNNDLFLRLWFEVPFEKIEFDCKNADELASCKLKWIPITKGGSFRRWYGNFNYVLNYENNGKTLCDYIDNTPGVRVKSNGRVINRDLYCKEGMTWSTISSSLFSMRYVPNGFIFETKGAMCFAPVDELFYLLGLYNTPVIQLFLQLLSPTLDYHEGPLGRTPIVISGTNREKINSLVKQNISLSQQDWDMFETSWNFLLDYVLLAINAPDLQGGHIDPLSVGYELLKKAVNKRFHQLKANEEELNRIFIDIYGLADELTPEESDKDVTVHYIADTKEEAPEDLQKSPYLLTREDVVKNLISYGVGCLLGRYSLDQVGLVEDRPETAGQYPPALLITDTAYFSDDIVGRFVDWLKEAAGEAHLEENLSFLASALGGKGKAARDVLRQYFLKNFYKDHVKTYQKRPIYWLFTSGRQQGFQALIYMHRWTADTMGTVRTEYLHPLEAKYEGEIKRKQSEAAIASSAREKQHALKQAGSAEKQLQECRAYDALLGHLANERPTIDLDDGVKVNYEKVQTEKDGKKYEVLAKI